MNKVFGVLAIIAAVVSFVIPFVGVFVAFAGAGMRRNRRFPRRQGTDDCNIGALCGEACHQPHILGFERCSYLSGAGALRFANHRHV